MCKASLALTHTFAAAFAHSTRLAAASAIVLIRSHRVIGNATHDPRLQHARYRTGGARVADALNALFVVPAKIAATAAVVSIGLQ